MLTCPRCKVPFEASNIAGIGGAKCTQCHGVWIHLPELTRALQLYAAEQQVVVRIVALLEGPARPGALHCPECNRMMELTTLRGVEVDKCSSCRAVFLERGEHPKIAERLILAAAQWDPAHEELIKLLRERWAAEASRADF